MRHTRALATIGLLLLLAGLLLGFLPQSAQGVGCGSVFRASSDAQVADLVTSFDAEAGTAAQSCDDRRGLYRPIVWVLIVLGAATLVGAGMVKGSAVEATP